MIKYEGHTPGPWTAHGIGDGIMPSGHARTAVWQVLALDSQRGGDIALCDQRNATENGANARLVAAAPDLLKQRDELAAMLKELIDKDIAMREHFGNRWPCDLDVTAQRASALLASLEKDS